MRLRPYLTLLRGNSAFGLAAVAAIGWIAFARPVWRRTGG
jgi:hypothetical protein